MVFPITLVPALSLFCNSLSHENNINYNIFKLKNLLVHECGGGVHPIVWGRGSEDNFVESILPPKLRWAGLQGRCL